MSFNIAELFLNTTQKFQNKTAYKFKKNGEWNSINYNELYEKVTGLALGLLSLGVRPKDRVGIASENRIEWIISSLAISLIGAVDVPIFPTLSAKQEEYIFNDCAAVAVFVSNKFQMSKLLEVKESLTHLRHIIVMDDEFITDDLGVKKFSNVIARGQELKDNKERESIINDLAQKISIDDLLTIIYTSGTTGNPKGVMLTHKNIYSNYEDLRDDIIPINETHTFLSFLPFCHVYERMGGFYTAFFAGSTVVLAESIEMVVSNIKEFKPNYMTTVPKLLDTIKKRVSTSMEKEKESKQKIFRWAVNTGIEYVRAKGNNKLGFLLSSKYKLADKLVFSKLRAKLGVDKITFVSGGAALSPETCEFFLALGYIVVEGYGLTEASPVIAASRVQNIEPGTVGIPLKSVQVRFGEDGEIIAKGDNIMKGYWNDKEATSACLDEEGWLYTGDIGIITEKGNIKITDRKKHILVSSGGKNIAPQPIENLVSQSLYVNQCFLVGDQREYCTALIIPDFDQLKVLAETFSIAYNTTSDLIKDSKIISFIKMEIDKYQKDLAKFERVRKFVLLDQPFSIENGELTPKLSVKRKFVERKYSDLIDQMY
jgi:long-chain acyl-CoA synthetase